MDTTSSAPTTAFSPSSSAPNSTASIAYRTILTIPFPLRQVFCHAARHILEGKPFKEIGLPAPDYEQRIALHPVTSATEIRGMVIHIDQYENVITNIRKDLFEQMCQGRRFEVHFKRHTPLTTLSRTYHDVPPGEPLCFFNVAGLLEIAVNMGKAASLLGIQPDDMVRITFHSNG
ncbi:MAG: hypothetical protein KatS3mg029_0399 [Saprospiraceae bacterium]|nr:MAG: hypothetical protein KatS3mg029_0399 [Saprospiraceae bacterium]